LLVLQLQFDRERFLKVLDAIQDRSSGCACAFDMHGNFEPCNFHAGVNA
jgi:hypothetical protein